MSQLASSLYRLPLGGVCMHNACSVLHCALRYLQNNHLILNSVIVELALRTTWLYVDVSVSERMRAT